MPPSDEPSDDREMGFGFRVGQLAGTVGSLQGDVTALNEKFDAFLDERKETAIEEIRQRRADRRTMLGAAVSIIVAIIGATAIVVTAAPH